MRSRVHVTPSNPDMVIRTDLRPGPTSYDLLPRRCGRVALVTGVSRRAGVGYAAVAHWTPWTQPCSTRTGRSTPAPRSCWLNASAILFANDVPDAPVLICRELSQYWADSPRFRSQETAGADGSRFDRRAGPRCRCAGRPRVGRLSCRRSNPRRVVRPGGPRRCPATGQAPQRVRCWSPGAGVRGESPPGYCRSVDPRHRPAARACRRRIRVPDRPGACRAGGAWHSQ